MKVGVGFEKRFQFVNFTSIVCDFYIDWSFDEAERQSSNQFMNCFISVCDDMYAKLIPLCIHVQFVGSGMLQMKLLMRNSTSFHKNYTHELPFKVAEGCDSYFCHHSFLTIHSMSVTLILSLVSWFTPFMTCDQFVKPGLSKPRVGLARPGPLTTPRLYVYTIQIAEIYVTVISYTFDSLNKQNFYNYILRKNFIQKCVAPQPKFPQFDAVSPTQPRRPILSDATSPKHPRPRLFNRHNLISRNLAEIPVESFQLHYSRPLSHSDPLPRHSMLLFLSPSFTFSDLQSGHRPVTCRLTPCGSISKKSDLATLLKESKAACSVSKVEAVGT
ncbi:hypothetical protein QQ045_030714 [Rhodiola kirilowii]